MKFSNKDFFSKCDQIRRKLRIWSHLLKKSLMENFIFCAVNTVVVRHAMLAKVHEKDKATEAYLVTSQTCMTGLYVNSLYVLTNFVKRLYHRC